MKILLINPRVENEILTCNLEIVEEERGYNPPLGILYVAAYLLKNSKHEVKVIDAQAEEMDDKELLRIVAEYRPDVVGITAMTFTLIDVLNCVGTVKRAFPSAKVVLGGPHVSIYPEETINLPGVDYLVLGEGEMTFCQLVSNIDNFEALRKMKGITFKENGVIVNTGNPDFISDLDSVPFPARELTPIEKYSSLLASDSPITTMFTSRGCPYRCTFCNRPNMGKVFRAVSASRVVDEMELCASMGIKEIFFYDDTFCVRKNRVLDICSEIKKRGISIPWDIRTRVDTMDEEILKSLKSAGCQRIHYGVESGSPRILEVLQKGINLEKVVDVFRMTRKHKITTFAYFMIGIPTETKADAMATIDFAKKLDPDYIQMTIFTPFPGTEIYARALKDGVFESDYWREFSARPDKDFKTRYWEKEMPERELKDLLIHAYKEFYGRPVYIIRKLARVRSFGELKRKVGAGLKLLKL